MTVVEFAEKVLDRELYLYEKQFLEFMEQHPGAKPIPVRLARGQTTGRFLNGCILQIIFDEFKKDHGADKKCSSKEFV